MTVGVAQLSFWFVHALQFCSQAQETDGVELVAAWDSDPERGQRYAREFDVPFIGDLDQLLSRTDVDAVSLCAEPFRQPVLAEAAAAAGKHLLIEKPVASNLAGARRLVDAVEANGVRAMPAYNLRHHPVALEVKRLVDTGELGRIARVRRLHGHSYAYERGDFDGRRIGEHLGWRDPAQERRDSLFFAGSHVALWLQWMFGSPLHAVGSVTTITADLEIEDNSIAILEYPAGFLVTIENSETMLVQGSVTELYGTDAVVLHRSGNLPSTRVWNHDMSPLMIFRRATEEWEAPRLPPEFLRHEPQYNSPGQFFGALLEDRPVPTDVYDAYDSIAILVAIEEAVGTGSRVPVEQWSRAGS